MDRVEAHHPIHRAVGHRELGCGGIERRVQLLVLPEKLPRQIHPDDSATRRARVLEDASAAHVEDDRSAC
jgi:hypothetical protein